jgi:hypothetical protein
MTAVLYIGKKSLAKQAVDCKKLSTLARSEKFQGLCIIAFSSSNREALLGGFNVPHTNNIPVRRGWLAGQFAFSRRAGQNAGRKPCLQTCTNRDG